MQNKFLSSLGLAQKAGKVVQGETLIKEIQSKHVYFVIIAEDASDNTKKKITNKCLYYHIPYVIKGHINDLSQAIGKYNRVALGITDKGFAEMLKKS